MQTGARSATRCTCPRSPRAQKGSSDALGAIGEIPSEDATRALVKLLSHADPAVARNAVHALAMRLPDPALRGALGPRNPFENTMSEQRKYLSRFYVADLDDAVRHVLVSPEVADVQAGAFMLTAVGTSADGPELAAALTAALEKTRTTPRETNVYPTPRGAVMELLRAATILVARGWSPPAPKTPGEVALWLQGLANAAAPRPAGWEAELGKALSHPIPYVQKLALERVPTPVSPAFVPKIEAALASPDVDTQLTSSATPTRTGAPRARRRSTPRRPRRCRRSGLRS
jgi:hypothetical protein